MSENVEVLSERGGVQVIARRTEGGQFEVFMSELPDVVGRGSTKDEAVRGLGLLLAIRAVSELAQVFNEIDMAARTAREAGLTVTPPADDGIPF